MKYFVKATERSNLEAERLGFNIEGLEFKISKYTYDSRDVRGYVVVHLYGNVFQERGPVWLEMEDLTTTAPLRKG